MSNETRRQYQADIRKEGELADEILYDIRRENVDAVRTLLPALCRVQRLPSGDLIYVLAEGLSRQSAAKWAEVFEPILFEALADPDGNDACPEQWARCAVRIAGGVEAVERRIDQLLPGTPLQARNAVLGYLRYLGKTHGGRRVLRFVRRRRDILRSHSDLWYAVGDALFQPDTHKQLVKWMSDWRQQDGNTPERLTTLAASLRHLNRVDAAREVSLAALELPEDRGTGCHLILLAIDDVANRDPEAAMDKLERARKYLITHSYNTVYDVIMAYVRFMLRSDRGRADAEHYLNRVDELRQRANPIWHIATVPRLFEDVRRAIQETVVAD